MFYLYVTENDDEYSWYLKIDNNCNILDNIEKGKEEFKDSDYKKIKQIRLSPAYDDKEYAPQLPVNIFKKFINVKEIIIEEMINLKYLNKNTFKYNTKLIKLTMIYNGFEDLPEELFKYNTQLRKIFIKHICVKTYKKNLLKGLTKLKDLTIGCNVNGDPIYIEKGFFDNVPQVKKLRLDGPYPYIYKDACELCIKYGADTYNWKNFGAKRLYLDNKECRQKYKNYDDCTLCEKQFDYINLNRCDKCMEIFCDKCFNGYEKYNLDGKVIDYELCHEC